MLLNEKPVFIEQRVSNACGTIALLHTLTNTSLNIPNFIKKDSLIDQLLNSSTNGEDLAKIVEEKEEYE